MHGCRFIEPLESRTLLSAANITVHPGITVSPDTTPAPDIQGYTPAQIRKAYGFDQVSFNNGAVAADGEGQTIAIIDPFNDPPVLTDLNVFDTQFGLPAPPSMTVVNQTGGAKLPPTNGSWAGEIATDVEWAHATAPAAKILLVEASTDNTDDLMAAVDYARHQAGVSVISISWGGGEFPGQNAYDSMFETPAGHIPITVAVAGGDNGAAGGAQWPGTSINVLSVGGSVLNIDPNTGAYAGETSWTDSSGGYSKFESEPSWQQVVQRTGMRSMPDIAFDADDNIGLALYDTVPFEGITGWQITNGTSVGTPQWAGLVAIADQARVLAGQPTLDGPSQTLPALYALYGAPGTSAYANYAANFHDILTPEDPSATRGLPTLGYDTTSGLGSPDALPIITALTNAPSAAVLKTTTQPLASPISVTITRQPPAAVVGGTAGNLFLRLTNASRTAYSGSITLTLTGSTQAALPVNPTLITTLTLSNVKLGAHASRPVKLSFTYPLASSAADDFLTATATTSAANTAPAEAVTLNVTSIAVPFITLSPRFLGAATVLVVPGRNANASILVKNLGNAIATGTISVNLYESSDQTLNLSTDTLLTTTPTSTLKLRPNVSLIRHLRFLAPANLTGGSYFLIASITTTVPGQTNTAVIATRGVVHQVHRA